MQTAKPKPKEDELTEDKPCIYGKEILAICPVRRELTVRPSINRYIKPKDPVMEEANEMFSAVSNMMNMEISVLSHFCESCPHRELWVKRG